MPQGQLWLKEFLLQFPKTELMWKHCYFWFLLSVSGIYANSKINFLVVTNLIFLFHIEQLQGLSGVLISNESLRKNSTWFFRQVDFYSSIFFAVKVDTVRLNLWDLLCCLYSLVTTFLYLQRGEHLTPVLSSRAYLILGCFDNKCSRFGELVPSTSGCHPSCICFLLMCQDYQCSLTISLFVLCVISYVCFGGMEAICWLVLESSWVMGEVMQYLKEWMVREIHLACVEGSVELPLLLRRLSVWPWDLNGRLSGTIVCQMSCEQGIPIRACIFWTKVVLRHFSVKWVNMVLFMLVYICLFKWASVQVNFGSGPHKMLYIHLCYFGNPRKTVQI